MARGSGKPWDESQVEGSEVANSLAIEKTSASRQARSRKSFPAKNEGRDGDLVSVINSTGTWTCQKVRGRWRKSKLEDV